jgi:hypothetical protein
MKALLLALAGLSAAHAEPTGTLTLACQGTVTDSMRPDPKSEPISMASSSTSTLKPSPGSMPSEVKILAVNEVTVRFGANARSASDPQFVEWIVGGTIDRLTWDVAAKSSAFDPKTRAPTLARDFFLKCRI